MINRGRHYYTKGGWDHIVRPKFLVHHLRKTGVQNLTKGGFLLKTVTLIYKLPLHLGTSGLPPSLTPRRGWEILLQRFPRSVERRVLVGVTGKGTQKGNRRRRRRRHFLTKQRLSESLRIKKKWENTSKQRSIKLGCDCL